MPQSPSHLLLYEINTRCWLRELEQRHGRGITLANVPEVEFQSWQSKGFSVIWLMGVWTGGQRARAQALKSPELQRAYTEALPDWKEQDVAASPYAIADYRVAEALGGNDGLVQFRQKLGAYGLKLILDFVPNHLGLDHPWLIERPELFVQAVQPRRETFVQDTRLGKRYLAYGKDPNWAAWTDTVQIDYRNSETRQAMVGVLQQIAELCDGVRCDMAMLVLNDVFKRTWKDFPPPGPPPVTEFWSEAISATRRRQPGFLFLAEVYWGLEARLRGLGFDFTYDKGLYDALVSRQAGAVQRHLLGLGNEQLGAGAHFLENHDEPRIAALLGPAEHRAAAVVILGLPGLRFLHEGQLEGRRKRLPVQLVRRAGEPVDKEIASMYDQLLRVLQGSAVGQGTAELLVPGQAWAGNPTSQHFILVQWARTASDFDLIVVNLAEHQSQCYAPIRLPAASAAAWAFNDLLGPEQFRRQDEDLRKHGLYLDLPAHAAQVFHVEIAAGAAGPLHG